MAPIETLEVYPVPNPEFCKQLHAYDPGLCLNWDPSHQVWAIWHKDPYDGSMNHVLNVVNPDGSAGQLDNRVFLILDRNRYFSSHPEELIEKVVDEAPRVQAVQEKKVRDDLRHLSRDKALKREWDHVMDTFKKIDWKQWITPQAVRNPNTGKALMGNDGHPIFYKPHDSLMQDQGKPVI